MPANKSMPGSNWSNYKLKPVGKPRQPIALVRSYEFTFVDLRLDNKQPRKTRIEKATSPAAARAMFFQHEPEHMRIIATKEIELKPASLASLQMLNTVRKAA